MSSIAESEHESARSPLSGARVHNRYRVQRVHSRGGSSVIYAAIDEQQRREVALKVLDGASAPNPSEVARFQVEARISCALAHPNLVAVLDYGRLIDGRPFLVTPMIAGTDLATLLARQGPQSPRRVATLLAGAGSALDRLHACRCIHRDIKSEKLMQGRDAAGRETTFVLDFGLASLRGRKSTKFMAPEALADDGFDHRSDIYSLATVAFELMTGNLPFERAGETACTLSQAAQAEFPQAVEEVIARALARRPVDRQSTASELIRELTLATAEPVKRMSRAAELNARSIELRMTALKVIENQAREVPVSDRSPTSDTRPASEPAQTLLPVQRRVFAFAAPAGLVVLAAIVVLMQGRSVPPVVSAQANVAAPISTKPEPAPIAKQTAVALAARPEPAPVAAPNTGNADKADKAAPRAVRAARALERDRPDRAQAKMLADLASDVMIGGEFATAATAYEQAIAADPDYAPAWRGKGLALEHLGKKHDAVAAFRRFIKLEPDGPSADKIRERLSLIEP